MTINAIGLKKVPLDAAIVSRYLLHEAQQAHYYGLPWNVALASVTSTAAEVLGYAHRIGYIREGYDAGRHFFLQYRIIRANVPRQTLFYGTVIPFSWVPHLSKSLLTEFLN